MQNNSTKSSAKPRQAPSIRTVKHLDRSLPLTTTCGVLTSQMSIPIDLSNGLGKAANGIDILFQCYRNALLRYEADSLQVSFYQADQFIENRIFNFHELMLLSETIKLPSNYPVRQLRVHIPTRNIPVFKDMKLRLFVGEITLNPDLPFNFNVQIASGKKIISAKVGDVTCSAY